jgi:hypothetical protein
MDKILFRLPQKSTGILPGVFHRDSDNLAQMGFASLGLQTDQFHRKRGSNLVERKAGTDWGGDVGVGHGIDAGCRLSPSDAHGEPRQTRVVP